MLRSLIALLLVAAIAAPVAADLPQPRAKKIISWRVPSLDYVREHPDKVAQCPLDGVMIPVSAEVSGRQVSLSDSVFGNEAVRYEDFAPTLEKIRSTNFGRLTDNFLLVQITPGDLDWFGDCSAFLHNARVAARFAREAGLKGITLDCEPYDFRPWDYRNVTHPERSFEEYYQQITLRGREFAQALWQEWPQLKLFLLFGYYVGNLDDPTQHHYGLYPAFLDGLFLGAPDNAEITDGWEMSYTYSTLTEFHRAYWWIRGGALALCHVPQAYSRKVKVGFGIWPDPDEVGGLPYGWDAQDFSINYRTPENLRATMRAALETTDEYLWLFSGKIDWCSGANVPDAYSKAMWDAKRTLIGLSSKQATEWAAWPLTPEFAKEHELIAALPQEWRLRVDTSRQERTWYLPQADDSEWMTVKTNDEWWRQLPFTEVTGSAWARVKFDIPAQYVGRRLYLWFGALDEEGDIYLNGKYVYTWSSDFDRAWETPFPVEITAQAFPGKTNLLAVRIGAESSLGGVFRPVYLYADK